MNTQIVKLLEIDAEIIPLIRKVDIESESYKGLNFSIQKDGQKNPIIIRELTDEEKANARENAVYGIIDGHHRYSIAKNNNADTIFAQIETRNPEDNNNYLDTVLAYRLEVHQYVKTIFNQKIS